MKLHKLIWRVAYVLTAFALLSNSLFLTRAKYLTDNIAAAASFKAVHQIWWDQQSGTISDAPAGTYLYYLRGANGGNSVARADGKTGAGGSGGSVMGMYYRSTPGPFIIGTKGGGTGGSSSGGNGGAAIYVLLGGSLAGSFAYNATDLMLACAGGGGGGGRPNGSWVNLANGGRAGAAASLGGANGPVGYDVNGFYKGYSGEINGQTRQGPDRGADPYPQNGGGGGGHAPDNAGWGGGTGSRGYASGGAWLGAAGGGNGSSWGGGGGAGIWGGGGGGPAGTTNDLDGGGGGGTSFINAAYSAPVPNSFNAPYDFLNISLNQFWVDSLNHRDNYGGTVLRILWLGPGDYRSYAA